LRTGDEAVAEEARSEKFGDSEAIILPELPLIAALLCRTDFIKPDFDQKARAVGVPES
jgi:hypothetical protein